MTVLKLPQNLNHHDEWCWLGVHADSEGEAFWHLTRPDETVALTELTVKFALLGMFGRLRKFCRSSETHPDILNGSHDRQQLTYKPRQVKIRRVRFTIKWTPTKQNKTLNKHLFKTKCERAWDTAFYKKIVYWIKRWMHVWPQGGQIKTEKEKERSSGNVRSNFLWVEYWSLNYVPFKYAIYREIHWDCWKLKLVQ